jgi:hypothetical protein
MQEEQDLQGKSLSGGSDERTGASSTLTRL